VRNIIKLLASGEILECAVFPLAVFAGKLFCEKAYLLRSAAALVLGPGVGEYAASTSAREFVHRCPCPARTLPVVDGMGVAFAERFLADALDE